MVMAARGRVRPPVAVPGISFVPVPVRLWFTEQQRIEDAIATPKGAAYPQLGHLLANTTLQTGANIEAPIIRSLSINLTFTTPGGDSKPAIFFASGADIYGPHCVARFDLKHTVFGKACNEAGAEATLTLESNAKWIEPMVTTTRSGYTLAEDELWLHLVLSYRAANSEHRTLTLFRPAKGVGLTGPKLGALVSSFEQWAVKEFQAKYVTDESRFAFLEDPAGTAMEEMVKVVKQSISVGVAIKEAEPPHDPRPEMTPEDLADCKEANNKKNALVKQLLAIPCVTGMWAMKEETLSMLPEFSLTSLLQSALLVQGNTNDLAAAWP